MAALFAAGIWRSTQGPASSYQQLAATVERLSAEVAELRREQAMPAAVLEQHRDSICFIYGVYSFGPSETFRPVSGKMRMRISGTGFLVEDGLLATNRHIAEPWYEDPTAEAFIRLGARPRLEKLVAFFPGMAEPIELHGVTVSDEADLALARFDLGALDRARAPLPLAETAGPAGSPVVVIGYPMGLTAMLAKSPHPLDRRAATHTDDIGTANELAALSLIRPSATHGYLGDVVADKLIYDAPTAQGASGGPVFNSRGEVIGVNAAYLEGFPGGTLGISVEALRALIDSALRGDEPNPLLPAADAPAED